MIEIRDYTRADRDGVLAVFRSNIPEHFAAEEEKFLRDTLRRPDGPLFVIAQNGAIVGFGGYEMSDHYNQGVLVWGMVHRRQQMMGHGRSLLRHRLRHLAAAPDRPRWVVVDTTPHIAGFYLRYGFETVAHWPAGYRVGFDRVDLRLELTADVVIKLTENNNE